MLFCAHLLSVFSTFCYTLRDFNYFYLLTCLRTAMQVGHARFVSNDVVVHIGRCLHFCMNDQCKIYRILTGIYSTYRFVYANGRQTTTKWANLCLHGMAHQKQANHEAIMPLSESVIYMLHAIWQELVLEELCHWSIFWSILESTILRPKQPRSVLRSSTYVMFNTRTRCANQD